MVHPLTRVRRKGTPQPLRPEAPLSGGYGEPVAWRVKDYADGWIIFQKESAAAAYRAETGALMEPLYDSSLLSRAQAAEAKLGEAVKALTAADEALAQFTAFEADAREIMGNTNFAIVQQRREQVQTFLSTLQSEQADD